MLEVFGAIVFVTALLFVAEWLASLDDPLNSRRRKRRARQRAKALRWLHDQREGMTDPKRCPTCGSDDPATPLILADHGSSRHGIDCPDPFHSPEAEQGEPIPSAHTVNPVRSDSQSQELRAEVERLRSEVEHNENMERTVRAALVKAEDEIAALREQLEQERAKRKAHAKASLNQQLERNRYREALERIEITDPGDDRWVRNPRAHAHAALNQQEKI